VGKFEDENLNSSRGIRFSMCGLSSEFAKVSAHPRLEASVLDHNPRKSIHSTRSWSSVDGLPLD
jgi:hypothetical protein